MADRIMLNQTSYHGTDAILEIANEAKAQGFQKALVCSDPDLIEFGVTSKVTDVLDKNGLSYEVYSDIKANPTIENVQNGVRAFRASGADYIVTIGGGSSMDTAKAIGIIAANPEFADVRSLEGVAPTKHPSVPIIAVPTTAEMCIRDSPSIKDFYKMICEYLVNTLMSRAVEIKKGISHLPKEDKLFLSQLIVNYMTTVTYQNLNFEIEKIQLSGFSRFINKISKFIQFALNYGLSLSLIHI